MKKSRFATVDHVTTEHAREIIRFFLESNHNEFGSAFESYGEGAPPRIIDSSRDEHPEVANVIAEQDAIIARFLDLALPTMADSLATACNEVLFGESERARFRKSPPSWELIPEERDPTEEEFDAYRRRKLDNLITFLATPRASYSLEDAAEILGEHPEHIRPHVAELFPWADQPYTAETILDVALERVTWSARDLIEAVKVIRRIGDSAPESMHPER
jgi:hypothetical protein